MSAAAAADQRPLMAGLLLAAGRARRMGTLKQTLAWPCHADAPPGATIVSSAFDALIPFCNAMFVVVGADAAAVQAALGRRTFTAVMADSDAEMFDSIRAGLAAIVHGARNGASAVDAALMQPADHPGVARSTIEALVREWRRDDGRAIMPEHRGKGGHPALIPLPLAARILDWQGADGGLRQYWIDHPDRRRRVEVNDPLCTLDIDVPADYEAAILHCKQGLADF